MKSTIIIAGFLVLGTTGLVADGTGTLKPLNSVPVPLPPNLNDFIANKGAAIQLGKALFWDTQLGGDGIQACATCHFQAGSDVRAQNCVNPGKKGYFGIVGPGGTIQAGQFPVNTGDIIGSSGIDDGNFLRLSGGAVDVFTALADPVYNVNGANVRQVTGRNAPSAVNAVFNIRNFWDGRANNIFNGVDPFGPHGNAFVYKLVNGVPTWVTVSIPNASLASQAVGPPNSPVEMAYAGRPWPMLGRKMLGLRPLALQWVAPTDSVLGTLADPTTGLTTTYLSLIKQAFRPEWWDSTQVAADGFTMREANFSLYFGLAVMLYESTLVSDQAPLDQFLSGNTKALTARQQLGLKIYVNKGRCDKCHTGPETTQAAVSQSQNNLLFGFVNTAVRPVAEDGGDILQPGQAKFKITGLRNCELNGPYFHNGNQATLRQVVDFYDRGGDFPSTLTDGDVRNLSLTEAEKVALVDFLIGMTDERVRFERAPFDHPAMVLPNGANLPGVGAAGRATPVQTFLGLSPFQQ